MANKCALQMISMGYLLFRWVKHIVNQMGIRMVY